jgi:transcriptional regulator with XRE-family HTH domain
LRKKKKDYIQIGRRIQDARKNAGFTQEQLSEAIDVTPQYLSDLERGVVGTSVLTLIKICTALQVSSDYLLFGHEENSAVSAHLIDRIQRLPVNYYALVDQYLNLLLATDSQPGNLADENQAPQVTQETDHGTSDQTTE